MIRLLAGAAALATIAGAADAASYRYDITLQQTSLNALGVGGQNIGPDFTRIDQPGLFCQDYDGGYFCNGTVDLSDPALDADTELNERFPRTVSGSLTLGPSYRYSAEYGPDGPRIEETGIEPECTGDALLCSFFSRPNIYARSSGFSGFTVGAYEQMFYQFTLREDGLVIGEDSVGDFTVAGLAFSFGNGLSVEYETTSLTITEVAPVPLPAGMALLPSALAIFAWRRRRARA